MAIMSKLKPGGTGDEDPEAPAAGPTGRDSSDVQQLRRCCHNTLHLVCVFLSDPEIKALLHGIHSLVMPLRSEFQEKHKTLRSCAQAAAAYADLAGASGGRKPLWEIVESMNSGAVFAAVGLHGPANKLSAALWAEIRGDADHPFVLAENLTVNHLGTFMRELLKVRMRSISYSERGYPGLFAKCLLGEFEARETLNQMRKDWASWQHFKILNNKPWPAVRARSHFAQMAVLKVRVPLQFLKIHSPLRYMGFSPLDFQIKPILCHMGHVPII